MQCSRQGKKMTDRTLTSTLPAWYQLQSTPSHRSTGDYSFDLSSILYKIMSITNWNQTRIGWFLFFFSQNLKSWDRKYVLCSTCTGVDDDVTACYVELGSPFSGLPLPCPKQSWQCAFKTVKSHHSKVIYPLYCIVYYSNQRSRHLWINGRRRLHSISSGAGREEWSQARSVMASRWVFLTVCVQIIDSTYIRGSNLGQFFRPKKALRLIHDVD